MAPRASALLPALLLLLPTLRALDLSQCIAPLGMESGLIPDQDLRASSSYNEGNVGPQNGRLNQELRGGAWCPMPQITSESLEWLEVDLHGVHVLTGVGTQGRFGNGLGQEFAEEYVLEYWRPRLGKWLRYRAADEQEVLPGNTHTYLEQKNQLEPPLWASKVRVLPRSSHRRTVCMRVELYGCYWTAGIVSYSMPRGNRRSNGVELTDMSYDGAWGDELTGGLGQLVDGRFGGDDIREAARPSAWVGWRNDSRPHPPHITFEFDRVREFSAVHIYCNNRFMRDVQVFSEAVISFSVGGQHYQEDTVRFAPEPDLIFESSRNVSIKLHHRIGKWVRIQVHFAARWILISEVVFDSDVAQGNYSLERQKAGGAGAGGVGGGGAGAGTRAPAGGSRVQEAGAGGGGGGVPRARAADPVYLAVVVGVLTALAILLAVAVSLAVARHRHRKCFASPLATGGSTAGSVGVGMTSQSKRDVYGCGSVGGGGGGGVKPRLEGELKADDYQEPYHPLKCAPYFSYSTVLLEMDTLARSKHSDAALSDSSNYEYAVPELSSEPLLSRRGEAPPAPPSLPSAPPPPPASHPPPPPPPDLRHAHYPHEFQLSGSVSRSVSGSTSSCGRGGAGSVTGAGGAVAAEVSRRLQGGGVPELPRHRLRMISKLAEGAFGTVYVAEADGVPEYDGSVTSDKRLVAVKFLAHDATDTEREEFERDVRILSALSCPQLARVVGVCRAPPLAVVLEYLDPGDLAAFLRAAAPPPHQHHLLHIALQLAAAMNYLEALNFVHRDLAARNCLIGKGYQVKISDFGTDNEAYACDYYRVGACREPLPLRWAAPETALRGRFSARSDAWAFAVLLHELFTLCRRRPYHHLTDLQVLENLSHMEADDGMFEYLERSGNCPRDLYEMMVSCWSCEERLRPTFSEMHALLQRRARAALPPA